MLIAVINGFSVRSENFDYGSGYNLYTWIGNLFLLQDYPFFVVLRKLNFSEQAWFIAPFGSARPFWTITIKWWLYMVFGCAVFFCVKRADRPERWPLPILAAVSIVPLYNLCGGYAETLIYLWIFGMCVAIGELRWWRSPRPANRQADRHFVPLCLAVAGVALFCMLARMAGRDMTGGEIPFAVMMTAMIFALYFALGHACRQVPRLAERVISFTADYSYSLYLIHNSIIVLCATQVFPTGWNPMALVTVVVLSHAVSIVFWFLFERHHRVLARLVRQALLRGSVARPLPAAPELRRD